MLTGICKGFDLITLMLILTLSLSGCATGYIVSTTQSLIGLDASGNAQTATPQIRFGFCRNQYSYLPTGKSRSKGGPSSGLASETPTLLSSIDADLTFLQSARIIEKFAVGKEAVDAAAEATLFEEQPASSMTTK